MELWKARSGKPRKLSKRTPCMLAKKGKAKSLYDSKRPAGLANTGAVVLGSTAYTIVICTEGPSRGNFTCDYITKVNI